MDQRRWKVGELAQATGLTVRTLHYFDEIGLLRPTDRSQAGHRLYTSSDVRRLYRVLALRQLGMPLGEIAAALDGDLEQAVERQLAQVEQSLQLQSRLHQRLRALLRAARTTREPSIDQLIQTMEAMMQASDFTADQLARMRARHHEPGFPDTMANWKSRAAHLAEEASAHSTRGTDPADPAVQELARRWSLLVDELTGGDTALRSALYAKLDRKGPEAATGGAVNATAWAYLKRAFAVGFGPVDPTH